jgi:hypothetical protein
MNAGGLKITPPFLNPQSEIRIPQSVWLALHMLIVIVIEDGRFEFFT